MTVIPTFRAGIDRLRLTNDNNCSLLLFFGILFLHYSLNNVLLCLQLQWSESSVIGSGSLFGIMFYLPGCHLSHTFLVLQRYSAGSHTCMSNQGRFLVVL